MTTATAGEVMRDFFETVWGFNENAKKEDFISCFGDHLGEHFWRKFIDEEVDSGNYFCNIFRMYVCKMDTGSKTLFENFILRKLRARTKEVLRDDKV
jgi:hypothetical protein